MSGHNALTSPDPSGKTIEEIRPIRDQIRDRVTDLLQRLTAALGPSAPGGADRLTRGRAQDHQ
jgi:hypothetical protein